MAKREACNGTPGLRVNPARVVFGAGAIGRTGECSRGRGRRGPAPTGCRRKPGSRRVQRCSLTPPDDFPKRIDRAEIAARSLDGITLLLDTFKINTHELKAPIRLSPKYITLSGRRRGPWSRAQRDSPDFRQGAKSPGLPVTERWCSELSVGSETLGEATGTSSAEANSEFMVAQCTT